MNLPLLKEIFFIPSFLFLFHLIGHREIEKGEEDRERKKKTRVDQLHHLTSVLPAGRNPGLKARTLGMVTCPKVARSKVPSGSDDCQHFLNAHNL